ncbi:VOC family protein [Nonomuraea angiospora]|uniref:VOC family protein n=1 Tax=Nonomuraea angiospora TaxID=46172 RepID=UPI0033D88684
MGEQVGAGVTAVRTVGVPVTDQDRAVEFYVGTLGLEERLDAPVEQLGGRWIEVAPPGATTTTALILAAPGTAAGVETGIRLSTADAMSLQGAGGARGRRGRAVAMGGRPADVRPS